MEVSPGDIVYASNDYEGACLVEVDSVYDEIGEYCDLSGPGFIGVLLADEFGSNVKDEAIELCYTFNMVHSKEN